MPFGNAFDLLDQGTRPDVLKTVFVTAYNHYALGCTEQITQPIINEPMQYRMINKAVSLNVKEIRQNRKCAGG